MAFYQEPYSYFNQYGSCSMVSPCRSSCWLAYRSEIFLAISHYGWLLVTQILWDKRVISFARGCNPTRWLCPWAIRHDHNELGNLILSLAIHSWTALSSSWPCEWTPLPWWLWDLLMRLAAHRSKSSTPSWSSHLAGCWKTKTEAELSTLAIGSRMAVGELEVGCKLSCVAEYVIVQWTHDGINVRYKLTPYNWHNGIEDNKTALACIWPFV